MISFVYTDMTHSHVTTIIISSVTMTTGTPDTTSQSCAPCILNSTCIQTSPPIVNSNTSTSSASWVGGILVGVVSGVLVMVIVWVIITVVSKKKSIIDRKRNKERFCMTIIIECLSVIFLDHMMMRNN